MADGVLFEIAGGIIAQLGNSALQEIGLLWGVKDELEKLKNTVTSIQAVLLDAEEKQALNHAIKNWLGRLKEVVFEADDLLDDFSTEALRCEAMTQNKKAKKVRIFFSKSNQIAYGLKMGCKIKAIREKLDAIEADNKQFGLVERLNETQVKTRPREEAHFFEHAKAVIGRENEQEEIIKLILNSDAEDDVAVLPIVGIGGLGKTTLAQLVFNDDKIKNHFEFLRLLDLHNMGIEAVPSSISKLKHLRYLDLSGIKELPNDITKLVNLRYLELDFCYGLTHMPRGLGKLTNLRELSLFVMSDDSDSVSRHHGKLKELSRLNDLRGELEIKNLRHGKDAALELKDANLKVKQYLQSLSLEWKEEDVNDADVVYDEQSLECLQPHPNLKKKFQHLPPIDCFPSLKEMSFEDLDSLEYVNSEKLSDSPILQSLKSLYIQGCPNLKGWWRREDSVEDGNYLTSMPLFPNLEYLYLENSSREAIAADIDENDEYDNLQRSRCPLTRVLRHLTALKSLCISDFDGDEMEWQELNSLSNSRVPLMTIPEWICNLTSLQQLDIWNCPNLTSLPEEIRALTSLQTLTIGKCPILLQRCKRETGEDWSKIAHIQNLELYSASNCANVETGLYPSKRAVKLQPMEKGLCFSTNEWQINYSVFGSILTAGGIVGALVNGKIADTLWFSEIFCIAGWLAIAIAKVPIHIAEITPKNFLGGFTSANQLMICCGFSLMYFIGNVIPRRMLALIGAIPCILELLGLIFIPESPKWLAKVGNEKEFETSLQCLRGWNADISQEAADIRVYSNFIFF
uniref:Rx N-terminal domain-containing protein n=1 Tax=Fagus sylvatica TaxID=28930 RepID=A0A2N9IV45_FAGSY